MQDVTHGIFTIKGSSYPVTDSQAWSDIACPSCRNPRMLVVAREEPSILMKGGAMGSDREIEPGVVTNRWLLCAACKTGAVADGYGQVWPPAMEFSTPDGTPGPEKKLWEEACECLAVQAYTAVAMLCRKLLLHLVFTHKRSQDPEAKPPNRMPFAAAVQYLSDEGIITKAMEHLAKEIKDIGNDANHELPAITGGQARKIALFTHYLFVSVYEMPKKAGMPTPFVGSAAEPYEGSLEPDASDEAS